MPPLSREPESFPPCALIWGLAWSYPFGGSGRNGRNAFQSVRSSLRGPADLRVSGAVAPSVVGSPPRSPARPVESLAKVRQTPRALALHLCRVNRRARGSRRFRGYKRPDPFVRDWKSKRLNLHH